MCSSRMPAASVVVAITTNIISTIVDPDAIQQFQSLGRLYNNCTQNSLIHYKDHTTMGQSAKLATPQVFPAFSFIQPLSPQQLLQEFFNIQFPSESYPTTSIAWLASQGLLEQFVKREVELADRTNCMYDASTPTATGCLLTASYNAVVFPGVRAIKGVLSSSIFFGERSFWQFPTFPSSEEVFQYSSSLTIPTFWIYLKACHCQPPSHPLQPKPPFPQQSVICWSEYVTPAILCLIIQALSRAPVVEKLQQFPHAPCIFTQETLLSFLQSTEEAQPAGTTHLSGLELGLDLGGGPCVLKQAITSEELTSCFAMSEPTELAYLMMFVMVEFFEAVGLVVLVALVALVVLVVTLIIAWIIWDIGLLGDV